MTEEVWFNIVQLMYFDYKGYFKSQKHSITDMNSPRTIHFIDIESFTRIQFKIVANCNTETKIESKKSKSSWSAQKQVERVKKAKNKILYLHEIFTIHGIQNLYGAILSHAFR